MSSEAVTSAVTFVRAEAPPGDRCETAWVVRFYVAPGDKVMAGAAVCRLRTERFLYDLPTMSSGIVEHLLVQPDEETSFGAPLLSIGPPEPEAIDSTAEKLRVRATPLARAIASAHGFDLGQLAGARPDRRIRAADVCIAVGELPHGDILNGKPPLPVMTVTSVPVHVWAPPSFIVHDDRPHAHSAIEVDSETGIAGRNPSARIIHATAQALLRHPWINSRWTPDGVLLYRRITLGLWRNTPDGRSLVLIQNAADLSLRGIERAMTAAPCVAELHAAAASVTFGVVLVDAGWCGEPQVFPGSAAALQVGSLERRVVVEPVTERLTIGSRHLLILSYDARHIAQPEADSLLSTVRARLEHQCRV